MLLQKPVLCSTDVVGTVVPPRHSPVPSHRFSGGRQTRNQNEHAKEADLQEQVSTGWRRGLGPQDKNLSLFHSACYFVSNVHTGLCTQAHTHIALKLHRVAPRVL